MILLSSVSDFPTVFSIVDLHGYRNIDSGTSNDTESKQNILLVFISIYNHLSELSEAGCCWDSAAEILFNLESSNFDALTGTVPTLFDFLIIQRFASSLLIFRMAKRW